MSNFSIGVLSSIAAATVIYLARFQFGFLVNLLFSKFFPNVQGKYLWNFELSEGSGDEAYINQKIYLHLKQVANRVKGKCEVFSGEELKREYSVKGIVSQTRVLRITFECEPSEHHDFGVGLFKLDSDGKKLSGITAVLCVSCQDITSDTTHLIKL